MRSDGTCPARLHERHTRSPFHGSSSSSLGVDRVSLELLCSAPRRSRLRPKSTDCPFPRLLGSLASPPPGPPVRAPSPFPTRERSARALRASRVRPHGVFQAVERPHAARARLSSVAFGRINIPRWQSPIKQHFPRSRRLTPPPPRIPPRRRPPRARHGRRREVPHRALRPRRDGPGASLAPEGDAPFGSAERVSPPIVII